MTTWTRRRFLGRVGTALAAAATAPWLRVAVAWSQQAVPFKLGPVVLGDLAIMAPVLVGVEKGFFREAGIAPERRGETLSLEELARLAAALQACGERAGGEAPWSS